jgi:hypothetical protein
MKHALAHTFTCKMPGLIALSTSKAGSNIPIHPARPGPWVFRETIALNQRAIGTVVQDVAVAIANLKARGYHMVHVTMPPVALAISA